jgi:DNA-binding MarR family transcriptional regulator
MSNRNRRASHTEIIRQLRTFSSGAILFNQRVAERVGLHLTDTQCMNLLDLMGTSTPGKLAEFMGLTTGGVTVMLDRLEKAGCIRREPNPEDRRSVLVRVNARKMEKLNALYTGVSQRLDDYIDVLPQAELEIVVCFFKQINALRIEAATDLGKRRKRT